ncbi:MAG TPA: crosslink repair DNA glycosylase YcaQ family protein [Candidatus Limnocylindrales bacterium]|nr:crosslink repair DNA glycosylase YcaQ family protein [Candidatus Limnocylindrales bacterium]
MTARLDLTREQILAFRRRVSALDGRQPFGAEALRTAASAGLTDSMPRAAVLSLHARVTDVQPSSWEDPSLVQVWGPRFSVYVVPADAVAPFTLGRLDEPGPSRRKAQDIADRMSGVLAGRRMRDRDIAEELGIGNAIRYAAPTGRFLIRWEGARAPVVWEVPAPDVSPQDARIDLARRYLHVFAPSTSNAFARWAGISDASGRAAFEALNGELIPARTPLGGGWILSRDEPTLLAMPSPAAPARLLPSGDTYFLLWGADRELLVPDAAHREELWTSRVWPGALLLDGDVVGTWRRANEKVSIRPWRRLTTREREAVELEATSLPLPGVQGRIVVRWEDPS